VGDRRARINIDRFPTTCGSLLEPAKIAEDAAEIGIRFGRTRVQLHRATVTRHCLVHAANVVQSATEIVEPVGLTRREFDNPRQPLNRLWQPVQL
jgi:hypothetical protein